MILTQEQLERIHVNYCQGMGACYANTPRGRYLETADFCIFLDGTDQPQWNIVNVKPFILDCATVVSKWETEMAAHQVAFCVEVAPWLEADFAPVLESRGYQKIKPLRCMVLTNLQQQSLDDVLLETYKINKESEFDLFHEVILDSYQYEPGELAVTTSLLHLPNTELFAANVGNEVAAVSMLYQTGDVAGIYWVGTKKAYQGKGLGGAVTRAALHAGQRKGCSVATLQASDAGEMLYRKLGFELIPYAKYSAPIG